jgi:hypothetical protein
MQIETQRARIAARGHQCFTLRQHKTKAGHAFNALIGRGDEEPGACSPQVDGNRAEAAHRVDNVGCSGVGDNCADLFDRIHDAGRRFAMDDRNMGRAGMNCKVRRDVKRQNTSVFRPLQDIYRNAVNARHLHHARASIGDRRYINGGYRRNENADLAAGYARGLVLSPFSGRSLHPLEWGTHLATQVDELRAGGSRVEIVFLDSNSQNALGDGMELMDLSRRWPSAQAGYTQGKALAEQPTGFWR